MSVTPQVTAEEKSITDALAQLGEKVKTIVAKPNRIKITTSPENLLEVADFIHDVLKFDHCTNITGTDYPKDKQLEITYHFGSLDRMEFRRFILSLGCRISNSNARLPSLIRIFPSANYHERETAEMIGCTFEGHPNLTRFILPEDWNDIPPLLKAYRLPGRLEEG